MHSDKEVAHFNLTAASSSRSGGACIPSCDGDDDQVEDGDQVDGDQVEDEDEDEDEVETEDEYAVGWSEKHKNWKMQKYRADSEPRHSTDFRTIFVIMIGRFVSCEIGQT